MEGLRAQIAFTVPGTLPDESPSFDVAQMEQALFNVLKNARESGSPPGDVCLAVRRRITINNRDGGGITVALVLPS